MKQELIAFWKYDKPPYFLSGTVESFNDLGMVSIKEFGGSFFKPVLIVPKLKGEYLQSGLTKLDYTYRDSREELEEVFSKSVDKLILGDV